MRPNLQSIANWGSRGREQGRLLAATAWLGTLAYRRGFGRGAGFGFVLGFALGAATMGAILTGMRP